MNKLYFDHYYLLSLCVFHLLLCLQSIFGHIITGDEPLLTGAD